MGGGTSLFGMGLAPSAGGVSPMCQPKSQRSRRRRQATPSVAEVPEVGPATRAPEELGTRLRRVVGLAAILGPALLLTALGRIALVTAALVAWTVWSGPGATDLLGRLNGPTFPVVCLTAAVTLGVVAWRRTALRPYALPAIGAVTLLPVAAGILLVSPVHMAIPMLVGVVDRQPFDLVTTLSPAEKAALLPVGPWGCLLVALAGLGLGHGLRRLALGPVASGLGVDPRALDLSVASRVAACALLLPLVSLLLRAFVVMFREMGAELPLVTELWLGVSSLAGHYGSVMVPLGESSRPLFWVLVGSALFVVSLSRSRAIRALPAALSSAVLASASIACGAVLLRFLSKL